MMVKLSFKYFCLFFLFSGLLACNKESSGDGNQSAKRISFIPETSVLVSATEKDGDLVVFESRPLENDFVNIEYLRFFDRDLALKKVELFDTTISNSIFLPAADNGWFSVRNIIFFSYISKYDQEFNELLEYDIEDADGTLNVTQAIEAKNGDLLLLASIFDQNTNTLRAGLYRLNQNLQEQWISPSTNTQGRFYSVSPRTMYETENGDILVCGSHNSARAQDTYNEYAYLSRYSSNGSLLWQRSYGSELNDIAYYTLEHNQNIYTIISSDNFVKNGGTSDLVLIKSSANGDSLQSLVFGSQASDFPLSFIKNPDGTFLLLTAEIGGGGGTSLIPIVYHLSPDMSVLKTTRHLTEGSLASGTLFQRKNGEVILISFTNGYTNFQNGHQLNLLKLNADGSIVK